MSFNVTCKDCLYNVDETCRNGGLQAVRILIASETVKLGTVGRTHGGHEYNFFWPKVPDDANSGCGNWAPEIVDYRTNRVSAWERADPTQDMLSLLEQLVALNPGAKVAEFLETMKK